MPSATKIRKEVADLQAKASRNPTAHRLQRALRAPFMLGLGSSLPKRPAATFIGFLTAPWDEISATLWNNAPWIKDLAKGAPVNGGRNFDGLMFGIGKVFTQGFFDFLDAIIKGQIQFEPVSKRARRVQRALQGPGQRCQRRAAWPGLAGFMGAAKHLVDVIGDTGELAGSIHDAIKAPVVRLNFEKAMHNSLKWEAGQGNDPTSKEAIERSYNRAITEALRAKLGEHNQYPNAVKLAVGDSPTAKVVFTGLQPTLRVPSNYLGQTLERVFGVITGMTGTPKTLRGVEAAPGAIKMIREGLDKFTPEQRDLAMRRLSKGTTGALFAVALLGFLGRNQFGGMWMPGQRRKKDDLPVGQIGAMQPGYLHNPLWATATFWAQVGKQYDKERAAKTGKMASAGEAVVASTIGLLDEFPLMGITNEAKKLITGRGQEEFVTSRTVPLALRPEKPPSTREATSQAEEIFSSRRNLYAKHTRSW